MQKEYFFDTPTKIICFKNKRMAMISSSTYYDEFIMLVRLPKVAIVEYN